MVCYMAVVASSNMHGQYSSTVVGLPPSRTKDVLRCSTYVRVGWLCFGGKKVLDCASACKCVFFLRLGLWVGEEFHVWGFTLPPQACPKVGGMIDGYIQCYFQH